MKEEVAKMQICACIWAHVHVHMLSCMCCTHVHTLVHAHAYMTACTHLCHFTSLLVPAQHVDMSSSACKYVYVYVHIYIKWYTCVWWYAGANKECRGAKSASTHVYMQMQCTCICPCPRKLVLSVIAPSVMGYPLVRSAGAWCRNSTRLFF